MKKLILPLLFFVFLMQSCINSGLEDDNTRRNTLPRSLTSSEETLISAGNDFSFDIFRRVVAGEEKKNVFISPLSISMALGMTLNGAAGETQTGMKEALGISELELQAINQSYQSLMKLLVELDPKVKLNIGNSLWGREGFPINQSFKDILKTYFDARVDELDFTTPAAADTINQWVNDQTNGRIEEIIKSIPNNIILYLINAIYFKGDWLYQFDPEDTKPADFHLQDGSTVDVEMMSQEAPVAVYRSNEVHMAELAYGDSLYQMTILMPADKKTPISKFVQESLTASNLMAWTGQLQSQETIIKLPKFESSYDKTLNGILKSMGMEEAFDPQVADFSNINPDASLYISEVKHKANITVNEEGSEAAAATIVSIGLTSGGQNTFRVDRPFVYLIRERISGTVLFAGMMKDPTQKQQ
ncbi:MAG: serpin family protein [Balneolaceae bacterium]|nr:serpin family protein [Balneolaceae bacterium]